MSQGLVMVEPQKDEATKAGDELLRRLLKTPPDPKGKTIERRPKAKPTPRPEKRDA